MTRLHEFQSKALLETYSITIPKGGVVSTADDAFELAASIGGPVVVKAQVWVTGRAGLGAIRFASGPAEVRQAASEMLGLTLGPAKVEQVLVEERLNIEREFYAGIVIDDRARAPVLIFSTVGGTGIEEIAREHPQTIASQVIDVQRGLREFEARDLVRRAGLRGKLMLKTGEVLVKLYQAARAYDARAAEVNPLALTMGGGLVAADCRVTIDDYAIYRQEELGIEVARDFARPPTELERIAWQIEKGDYRGTFYFIQMERDFQKGDGVIGFHGAGGGGSMMSMDALTESGFRIANFVDTSGNPPASKVYRAARIILSQKEIDGYFHSGSGVASQEQYHSARGLVKAFLEAPLAVPAVIRLGGNEEAKAISILHRLNDHLLFPVEGYGKDDTPEFCAGRLHNLLEEHVTPLELPSRRPRTEPVRPYSFDTVSGGTVTLDHALCQDCESKVCIETCDPQILSLEDGVPVLNISSGAAGSGGCIECLACEVECYFLGNKGGYVHLPIGGLDDQVEADRSV